MGGGRGVRQSSVVPIHPEDTSAQTKTSFGALTRRLLFLGFSRGFLNLWALTLGWLVSHADTSLQC